MEKNGGAVCENNRDEKEDAETGIFKYADEYG
jgi:hypothetical protein